MKDNESITVTVKEISKVFMKVNLYLASLPKKVDGGDKPKSVQERLDQAAALWEQHFGIKVNAIWGTNEMTFTFKDKSAFALFMLEWS